MTRDKVGYLVGSLAKASINRLLATALVRLGDHVVTVVTPSAAKRSSSIPSSYRLGAAPLV